MKTFTTILFWLVIAFSVIQFIPVDTTNKSVKKSENFVNVFHTPVKVQEILKNACYDCHSNETAYPYYAFIAPFSWSVKSHINNGRKHLNFSEWSTFNKDLKEGMLTNAVQEIEQRSMPMQAYVPYHPKANLTDAQRKILTDYFNGILKTAKF